MNGFHIVYGAFILFSGLFLGILGFQRGATWGAIGAFSGVTIAYLVLVLLANLPRNDLPNCSCGRHEKYKYVDLEDLDPLWLECECGQRYFIKSGRMCRKTNEGDVVQIAHRTWYGRWISE